MEVDTQMGPIKLIRWALWVFLVLGAVYGFGHVTVMMAEAAANAQQHDQVSYGQFTRTLWAQPHAKKRDLR
jgi:hypothetical protein